MVQLFSVLAAALLLLSSPAHAQAPLAITDISANGTITGTVSDSTVSAADACVVVYVHTDIWYIHPYAGGGEGRSWAKVAGRNWSIPTVKREFPANQVAAVLLRKDRMGECPAAAKLEAINGLDRHIGAPFIKPLANGDAWYGRL